MLPDAGPSVASNLQPWPVERLREGLSSSDAKTRTVALAMVAQPSTQVDSLVAEIARAAGLAKSDEAALMMATAALGNAVSPPARQVAIDALCLLAQAEMPAAIRRMVARNFWAYKVIPAAAWPAVADMVFSEDARLRQVAFAAAVEHAVHGAAAIAQVAAAVGPDRWTVEGLDLLASSAGDDEGRRDQVFAYVQRSLNGATSTARLLAGAAALARLRPNGPAVSTLCAIAAHAKSAPDAQPAFDAISQLGERAAHAIPELVSQLRATDDPEREEALCNTLLALRIEPHDVPVQRVIERIREAPALAVKAHCTLVALHAKAFARLAPVIAERFSRADESLQALLDVVHEMLTGRHLMSNPLKFAA